MRATTTERPETKMQGKKKKKKSNFRKYNRIKSKYLLCFSKVEMLIKIAFVGVWCWGEKLLVNRSRLLFKNKSTA